MFGDNFKICMAIAENINGAHHIWKTSRNLSYISLNGGGLVFVSTQEKFQVLGRPSIKWCEEHFIDIDKTAKRLAMKILGQVEEYVREGKTIITAEDWLAQVEAFELKKLEWCKPLWVDDIEKLEIARWADFLETQENLIFQTLAIFLNCHCNRDEKAESDQNPPLFRELLESEIVAANKLADFLGNHSNDLLREGAEWIPQWIECY